MPNWEEIQNEWETTKITLAALAEKYDVKLGTLKSRKSRDKWSRGAVKKDATKTTQKVATPAKRMQPKIEQFEPVVESVDLTDKQRDFCIHYIKYFNATKAYQKAYNCDYMTANASGSRLLVNVSIRAEIERMKREREEGLMLNAYDVLQKYMDIAFADIGDYVKSDDGYLVSLKPLDEVDTSIVSEISNTENGPKLKLADKMKALEMLAKYTDLLSDGDKKRLQEEKLKVDIAKAKAEVEKITKENTDEEVEDIIIVDEWGDDDGEG